MKENYIEKNPTDVYNYYLSWLPAIAALTLVICWIAVIIVDILNIGGLGDAMVASSPVDSALYGLLFTEGNIIEWMQWTCIGVAAITAAQVSALYGTRVGGGSKAAFSILMAILFVIMIMEDAGNLRHHMKPYLNNAIHASPIVPWDVFIYAVYASIPLYAVWQHGEKVRLEEPLAKLFWLAVLFYGLVSVMSATGNIGGWYNAAGDLLKPLFDGRVDHSSGAMIMDQIVEESIELIGAILFASYYTRYWAYSKSK